MNERLEETSGSLAHSTIQSMLAALLINDGRFIAPTELTLDISQVDLNEYELESKNELKPDVCLYEKKKRREPGEDVGRMVEMPLLVIEVLSPEQKISVLINKMKAYFALGVKSFWLVIPQNETVTIYSAPTKFAVFSTPDAEIVDEVLDIRLPIQKIFEW
jgi:Uma2 family endonuclease